jgi:hypothetical protein
MHAILMDSALRNQQLGVAAWLLDAQELGAAAWLRDAQQRPLCSFSDISIIAAASSMPTTGGDSNCIAVLQWLVDKGHFATRSQEQLDAILEYTLSGKNDVDDECIEWLRAHGAQYDDGGD